jgi:hypothetical protein
MAEDSNLRWAIAEMKEHHEVNYDADDDDGDYTDEDAIDDLITDCGRTNDGGCSLAGTEYCDWECPFTKR